LANTRPRPKGQGPIAPPEEREENKRIKELLGIPRTMAVVGMSPRLERPGRQVRTYLHTAGFEVVPVHPTAHDVSGLRAYRSLVDIPREKQVDLVDVIVSAEHAGPVAEQASEIGAKVIWFQPGAENPEEEQRARELGLEVFSGRCIMADHLRLIGDEAR